MHDPGLGLFRLQAEIGEQTGQPRQRGDRLPLGLAEHHQIIGVPGRRPVRATPCPVEPVQVDVSKQRGYHPTLRGTGHGPPDRALVHHPNAQKRAEQPK